MFHHVVSLKFSIRDCYDGEIKEKKSGSIQILVCESKQNQMFLLQKYYNLAIFSVNLPCC